MTLKRMKGRRGQTLIEALVALSILTVGFMGISQLLAQSFNAIHITSEQTTATYLAAEGIELTKSLLDSVMYGNGSGVSGWPQWPCFANGGQYGFDYTVQTPGSSNGRCNLNPQRYKQQGNDLEYDPVTGYYGYNLGSGAITTGFKRTIYTSYPSSINGSNNGCNEVIVTSVVTWNNGLNSVAMQDDFYNWLPTQNPIPICQ